MKKGFTLVEMAIVLVIVGILMALVSKGRELIESAKDRSEVAKIKRLEIAVSIYSTQHKNLWLEDEQSFLTPVKLVKIGLLSENDVTSNFRDQNHSSHSDTERFKYNFLNYRIIAEGADKDLYDMADFTGYHNPNRAHNDIAISDFQSDFTGMVRKSQSYRFICVSEKFIDGAHDESSDNFRSGMGRALYSTWSDPVDMAVYLKSPCSQAEKFKYRTGSSYALAINAQ